MNNDWKPNHFKFHPRLTTKYMPKEKLSAEKLMKSD